jgi:hypothetical protein
LFSPPLLLPLSIALSSMIPSELGGDGRLDENSGSEER